MKNKTKTVNLPKKKQTIAEDFPACTNSNDA